MSHLMSSAAVNSKVQNAAMMSDLRDKSLIIFDWDGTLMDSMDVSLVEFNY